MLAIPFNSQFLHLWLPFLRGALGVSDNASSPFPPSPKERVMFSQVNAELWFVAAKGRLWSSMTSRKLGSSATFCPRHADAFNEIGKSCLVQRKASVARSEEI
jgi:hypothetical protein